MRESRDVRAQLADLDAATARSRDAGRDIRRLLRLRPGDDALPVQLRGRRHLIAPQDAGWAVAQLRQ